jgi:hypothetical protein
MSPDSSLTTDLKYKAKVLPIKLRIGLKWFMAKRKIRMGLIALILSSLFITTVSAAIYFQIISTMSLQATVSWVIFTNGEDTATCGGDLTTNTSATFSSIPISVGSNITITQLVNITNTHSSAHTVTISVSSENFGSELSTLLLYLVSPSNAQTLAVKINGSGTVVTQNVQVSIPNGQVWAIELIGCYDAGTPGSQSNSMTLGIQVAG